MLQRLVDRYERLHTFWGKVNSTFGLMSDLIYGLDVTTMLAWLCHDNCWHSEGGLYFRGPDQYIILGFYLLQVVVVGVRLILMTIPVI